ncbi:MAG: FtsX-like permease family protein [Chloroflexota bacterium]|nr:FtsX-like permease family protein [Chloroflexota bacterium]
MDTFFGLSTSTLAWGMLLVVGSVGGLLLVLAGKGWILLKMGVRNIMRRPTQTALIICGLTLSCILITTSLGLGASVSSSLKDSGLAQVGNLDEGLSKQGINGRAWPTYFSIQEAQQVTATVQHIPNVAQVAGALITAQQSVALYDATSQQVSAENVVLAVPPDFNKVWGPLTDSNRRPLSFASLQAGEIYIGPNLAAALNAHAGDRVQLIIQKHPIKFTIRAIMGTDINPVTGNDEIILPLGQFQRMLRRPGAVNIFFLRNQGEGGLANLGPNNSVSNAVASALRTQFPTYTIATFKANAVTTALATGSFVTIAILAFGFLLQVAGALLIYLIFTLLAGERKTELGICRALGMQRGHLVRAFMFEGTTYTLGSILVGVPLGIGITALLIRFIDATPSPLIGTKLYLQLQFGWVELVLSACLGLLVTFLVVTFSAVRVSRLNIVVAIYGLAEAPVPQKYLGQAMKPFKRAYDARNHPGRFLALAVLAPFSAAWQIVRIVWECGPCMLLSGLLLTIAGVWSHTQVSYLLGVSLLLLGAGLTLRTALGKRPRTGRAVLSLLSISLLAYWSLPFGTGERFLGIDNGLGLANLQPNALIPFLSPLIMIVGVIWFMLYNGDVLVKGTMLMTRHLGKFAPITHISMAYPLHFKFRTGLTVILFALVTFTLVTIVMLTNVLGQTAQPERWNGGWQIQTDSPGLPPDLIAQVHANPLLSHEIETIGWQDVQEAKMQVIMPGKHPYVLSAGLLRASDDSFLASTNVHFQARAAGYTTDQQVWGAIKDQEGLAAIHDPLGFSPASPLQSLASGFQPFTVQIQDPQNPGTMHSLKVIGILPHLFQWPGLFLSTRTGGEVFTDPHMVPKWYLFRVYPGIDPNQARLDLGVVFGSRYGLQPELVQGKINNELSFMQNLTTFLTGYLALGLAIGICGLGIISSLSVVERRQQIGMLRAIGYTRGLLLLSFLLESGFIAILGLLMGAGLGIWATYRIAAVVLLTTDNIQIPILQIGLLLLLALLATLLATWMPARAAARLLPAEALRYE